MNAMGQASELLAIREAVQTRLDQLLPAGGERDLVTAASREGALAPGKRIRPVLLMLIARDLGCDNPAVLDLACAVEMVHAASLALDDLPCMDNASLRRGRPTLHRQFGEDVAILAAIGLLSRAFGVIAAAPGLSDSARVEAVAQLSATVGLQGLVQGQFQDLRGGAAARGEDAIARTNELKTGVLFSATLQLAAIASDACAATRQSLAGFATELGHAFQLLDDLADGSADHGKDAHQDLGKSTLVALLGVEGVRQRLQAHLRTADDHLACACGQGVATRRFMRAWFDQQLGVAS
ncbi:MULTISPECIES: polyprenyl synthetase family protein [unclassified Pseudomonas]|uniref:polyprenyl synthetase family protein n=1 Tax=unclassified Pseudomonas TaxID=196821 RepID=UPI000BCA6D94|nr:MULTISPECIES: polyprenyl synthetase family protein [unclassified Pseudomonas]PVZ20045.1 geranylgeranyl diphosphate synthase type II [Pseudomonas sp. URIL14HWK12:I12]PVZ27111.1 geranylgeranyl diphosphate synthase type II [Pseudomonas sp. URIL14HWK12:I10]PVZ38000.1 geranylgeranyl diphosphate synthase type II [Pseudomonas sp. URIL14HWK12:I11]SNZ04857.1 geranylgeranyl diphosphate synthase, type II [Pseudomonas sp. URIL14HWK12:I9]